MYLQNKVEKAKIITKKIKMDNEKTNLKVSQYTIRNFFMGLVLLCRRLLNNIYG